MGVRGREKHGFCFAPLKLEATLRPKKEAINRPLALWVLSSDRGVGRLIDQGFVSVVAEGTGVVVPPHGVAQGEGAE